MLKRAILFVVFPLVSYSQPLTPPILGIPRLADYEAFYLASAEEESGQHADAIRHLDPKNFSSPPSPLAAAATLLRAKAFMANQQPSEAIRILREVHAALPQPDADFALASAYEAQGEPAQAAIFYQRVYYEYPITETAAQASAALDRLRLLLGPAFPPPSARQILDRGDRWLAGKDYAKAKLEFQAAVPQLEGPDRDLARVRIGVADYSAGDYYAASRYLKDLRIPHSETDAERAYYLVECARKMGDDGEMTEALQHLATHYEKSAWRLKALVSAANRYLVERQPERYEPLYRAAYENFPADSTTSYSHWKVAWNAYLSHRNDAANLLREQVQRYPSDARAAGALYFLGRLAESGGDPAAARAYYSKISQTFPHYYYAMLARERLRHIKPARAKPSMAWLNAISFPRRHITVDRTPEPVTKLRIERADLLASAGFADWAESELRFAAKNDGQPYLIAIELARITDSPFKALRFMKSFAPDYLALRIDQVPSTFWRLLFPMPYQSALVKYARLRALDPYLVAALIRQESEFNPGAVSRANALGLTQVMPATGQALAKQSGISPFSPDMLFDPEINLRLGMLHLRSMLDQWDGKWEETLASYNAGKRRVQEWLSRASYSEPAEFVESIPFTETREYVQAVLRNAEIYRQIYRGADPQVRRRRPRRRS